MNEPWIMGEMQLETEQLSNSQRCCATEPLSPLARDIIPLTERTYTDRCLKIYIVPVKWVRCIPIATVPIDIISCLQWVWFWGKEMFPVRYA